MTLLRTPSFNPWKDFDRLLGSSPDAAPWMPAFDITETDEAFVLHGDLPGVSQKDIEVRLDENVLSVSGERSVSEADGGPRFIRRRRPSGKFRRRFVLPENVNHDDVKASYVNGVLELIVPKQVPVDRSRLIEVN